MMGGGAQSAEAAEPAVIPIDPAIAQIDAFIKEHPADKTNKRWRTRLTKPPILKFDPAKTYTGTLDTNIGEIRFRLYDDIAPMLP